MANATANYGLPAIPFRFDSFFLFYFIFFCLVLFADRCVQRMWMHQMQHTSHSERPNEIHQKKLWKKKQHRNKYFRIRFCGFVQKCTRAKRNSRKKWFNMYRQRINVGRAITNFAHLQRNSKKRAPNNPKEWFNMVCDRCYLMPLEYLMLPRLFITVFYILLHTIWYRVRRNALCVHEQCIFPDGFFC